MNTFLNAMTYPDKTVYPVASCNEKDFRNVCLYGCGILSIYTSKKRFSNRKAGVITWTQWMMKSVIMELYIMR